MLLMTMVYDHLSNQGKLRRLRNLANQGLSHYDLRDPQLTYHGFETNLLYRVTTGTGERFMLRLAYPGWRTLTDLLSEAAWVNALNDDTDIPVPAVMPTRSGEHVLSISTPDVPDLWHMTLMRWVPGRLLGHYLTTQNLEKMGALFAKLHQHGASWTPPANFTKRRFEHWLSRGEENLLLAIIQDSADRTENDTRVDLSQAQRDLLERVHLRVEAAYQAMDLADLRVIHCDLWHDNFKLHRGVLHPFDFEDTVWGYRAHDIAMAMLDLLEMVGEACYVSLLLAFKRGYQSHLDWPEDRIEPFQIGRMLWMINWMARHQPGHLSKMIGRYIPVFNHYERTEQVVLPQSV